MILKIDRIEAGVRRDDEAISFPFQDPQGHTHTVELSPAAQNTLLKLILASTPVQSLSKPGRILPLKSTKVMATSQDRIGLILELSPGVALHCLLDKSAAKDLAVQIHTTLEQDVPKH